MTRGDATDPDMPADPDGQGNPDSRAADGDRLDEARFPADPRDARAISLTRLAAVMVLVGLVLAAVNLRPAVTSLGPVLAELRTGLGMSSAVAGLLTALPAVCFVVFGSLAPRMVARTFPSLLVFLALVGVAVGLALRPFVPGAVGFVLLSSLALGGIGVANIMMPVVVQRAFPHRIGPVTGMYSMGLTLGAATAAATTVPLTHALGGDWRLGLAAWAVPAAAAAVVWSGLALWIYRRAGAGRAASPGRVRLPITRSRTAWAVAILFGLQSTQAYVTMGWIAQIYRDAGLSATYAGVLLALIPAVGVPTSFLVPTIAGRLRQSGLAIGLTALGLIGYLGLWLVPALLPWLWVLVLGVSQGVFPLVLALIGMRTRTGPGVVSLSAFGQSVGYLISIPGPIVVGALYGATGGWHLPIALMAALLVPQAFAGLLAGRRRFVEDDLGLA